MPIFSRAPFVAAAGLALAAAGLTDAAWLALAAAGLADATWLATGGALDEAGTAPPPQAAKRTATARTGNTPARMARQYMRARDVGRLEPVRDRLLLSHRLAHRPTLS